MAIITLTPKKKIGAGILLSAGGAYGIYRTIKADKKNKLAFGLVSGLLLVGGILLARKGYVQNKSLRTMPQEVDKPSDDVKKVIADAIKEGKVSNSASGESATMTPPPAPAPVKPASAPAPSKPMTPQQKADVIAQKEWQNGRVVGKIDLKKIEESKARNEKIFARIEQLRLKHDALKKEKGGWQKGLPLRNEIEILKAQLYWC
jgi:hypothetical protein